MRSSVAESHIESSFEGISDMRVEGVESSIMLTSASAVSFLVV